MSDLGKSTLTLIILPELELPDVGNAGYQLGPVPFSDELAGNQGQLSAKQVLDAQLNRFGGSVEALQTYLLERGHDLGRSGANKNGIDGDAGARTLAAAYKDATGIDLPKNSKGVKPAVAVKATGLGAEGIPLASAANSGIHSTTGVLDNNLSLEGADIFNIKISKEPTLSKLELLIKAQDTARKKFKPDSNTYCNQATEYIASEFGAPMEIFVNKNGARANANEIGENLARSDRYTEVTSKTEAQSRADKGELVISSLIVNGVDGKGNPLHGHVNTVRPQNVKGDVFLDGSVASIPVPIFNDVGRKNGIRQFSWAYNAADRPQVKFYAIKSKP